MNKYIFGVLVCSIFFFSCKQNSKTKEDGTSGATEVKNQLVYDEEVHLKNVKQLTYGGDNAEAYWSFDNKYLIFQRTNAEDGVECDQIFIGSIPNENAAFEYTMVSTGKGRTTCSYFLPESDNVIYASTHLKHEVCPPVPDHSKGYVWPLYPEFEIFLSDREGNIVEQLTDNEWYDAEATTHPTKNIIVYTSDKSGDLELYLMDLNTKEEVQVTTDLGYDGGAFFSPDGTKLVWRASRPTEDSAVLHYTTLLKNHLVEPSDMELFVADVNGMEVSNIRQITNLGNANWAPYFHPSNEKIIFCSNHKSEKGFPFNLFMINIDGTGLEQITHDEMFDSFPMFSYDGKYLVFASNRNNGGTRDTNLFLAEWAE